MPRFRSSSLSSANDNSGGKDTCGRDGCNKQVQNGIQCSLCNSWYHFNCTGLKKVQYTPMIGSDLQLKCMSCSFTERTVPSPTRPLKSKTTNLTSQEGLYPLDPSSQEKTNAEFASLKSTMMNMQAGITALKAEIESLNEYLALTLPCPVAAKQALKMSEAKLLEVATTLKDNQLRQRRVVIWGNFSPDRLPSAQAEEIICTLFPNAKNQVHATFLHSKKTNGLLG